MAAMAAMVAPEEPEEPEEPGEPAMWRSQPSASISPALGRVSINCISPAGPSAGLAGRDVIWDFSAADRIVLAGFGTPRDTFAEVLSTTTQTANGAWNGSSARSG
jgi:hypothetical protein